MNRNINLQNIEDALSSLTYPIPSYEIPIEAIFELEKLDITSQTNDLNFSGFATCVLDTEYGGGPVSVKVDFVVKKGQLSLNLASLDYKKLLNWKEIESEANVNHSYIEDEEDETEEIEETFSHEQEDLDYFFEEDN